MLDDFLYSKGLAAQLAENFQLINGQVEFVSTNPKLMQKKKSPKPVTKIMS